MTKELLTEHINTRQLTNFAASLDSLGFQRLQHLPGVTPKQRIPENVFLFRNENHKYILIEEAEAGKMTKIVII